MDVYKRRLIAERIFTGIVLVVIVSIYFMVGPPGWRYREQPPKLSERAYDQHISSQGMMPISEPRHDADEHAVYYLQSIHDMSYMLRHVENYDDAVQVEPDFKNAVAEMNLVAKEFAEEDDIDKRSATLRYAPNMREAEHDLKIEMNHLQRHPRAAELLAPIINERPPLNLPEK